MKKRVMILGAGRGQIPLINLCHKYGAHVIAVSPRGDYPGFKVCDEAVYEDIKDKDEILKHAKHLSIDAILSDQLDQAVSTAAFIAEKLNLPGISEKTADKFTNKFTMRKEAELIGINVPKSVLLENINDAKNVIIQNKMIFPLMMKPVDGAASNGVFKVNSIKEIEDHFEYTLKFSKVKKIIVESFIEGKEFVVEAYTHNYKVHNLMVGHRDYFDIPGTFIPSATIFQDAQHTQSDVEKELLKINEILVQGFGLKFGITHAEYLVEKNTGKIYLVEIAARGGGVFISSEIIPATSSVNANELLVKDALGIYDDEIVVQQGSAAYFCFLAPEGVVKKIEGIDYIKKIPGVKNVFLDNIYVGMKTTKIVDKYSRKGPIIVQGTKKTECYTIIEHVKKLLDIEIESTDGLKRNIIWE